MTAYRIEALPDGALDAAAAFYAQHRGAIAEMLEGEAAVAVVFAPAPYDHRDWRSAAIADLARAHAPARRVNGLAGEDEAVLEAALAYLDTAPGITGQYFELDAGGYEVAA